MCENIKKNIPFLQLLARTNSDSQRYALLKTATPTQVRVLSEISYHVLTGHCKINRTDRQLFRSKINTLKKLASRNRSYKSKKRIINQQGGAFFNLIVPLLGAILPTLLSK